MAIAGEVDGGVAVDHHVIADRHHGFAAVAGTADKGQRIVEAKAQLVHHVEAPRRDGQAGATILQPLQQRNTQQLFAAVLLHGQRVILHKLVVKVYCQPRTILLQRRGVAVAQIHVDAACADQKQVRRQVEGKRQRRRLQPIRLQLARILLQLGKGGRAVGAHPVRRVVGLAVGEGFHPFHLGGLTAQQQLTLRDTLHRRDQIVVVTPEHQQYFLVRISRLIDDLHRRLIHRGQRFEEVRPLGIGSEHHRVLLRGQLVQQHREVLPTPLGFAAKPRREYGSGALLAQIRRGGKHHRQAHRAAVARVKERFREVRKVIFQRQLLQRQLQPALLTDIQPDRAVSRVFADIGVMPDQFEADAVEIADKARVDRHLRLVLFPQLIRRDGYKPDQLVVEGDFQLRQRGDQRRGRAIAEVEQRVSHHFVTAHPELNLPLRLGAAQRKVARRRCQLGKVERRLAYRGGGQHLRFCCRGFCGGGLGDECQQECGQAAACFSHDSAITERAPGRGPRALGKNEASHAISAVKPINSWRRRGGPYSARRR
ncbi:Uncharacterised protein [Klebsiella pneumoniae]|nr:Uncharacterised protein [Klebsiella pneumoniae]